MPINRHVVHISFTSCRLIGMLWIYRLPDATNYHFMTIDRHVVDISFTVSFFVSLLVCPQILCNWYLRRRLMQGDEIWQDGRPGYVAGHLLFWWTLAQGLAPKAKNWKMLVMHWTVASQVWQTGRWQCCIWLAIAGYAAYRRLTCGDICTPVRITGVLVNHICQSVVIIHVCKSLTWVGTRFNKRHEE